MFEDFSHEHLATASIGQVHEAKLNTGEKIAVKVQREGITDKVSIVALVSALSLVLQLFLSGQWYLTCL